MSIARVEPLTTARALRGPFDYLLPERLGEVGVGTLLQVPFGRQRLLGVVVEVAERTPGRATEPDDRAVDANELAPGVPVTGHLERRADVDHFRFTGPPGAYRLTVEVPAELPLRWTWQGATTRPDGAIELAAGAILRVERNDALEGGRGGPRAADRPYVLGLSPADR